MMLEAVTFDFWETLAQDSAENLRRARDLRVDGLRAALRGAGFERPREALEAAHDEAGRRMAAIWETGKDAGTREQVRILLGGLDPSLPGAVGAEAWPALEEAYAAPALSFPPVPRADAARALWGLRARGVRIGLISNTGRTPGRILRIILQRAGLLEHFEALTFSDEAGIRKPDPRVFRWTLNKLGARPEQAAHVGDNLAADVGGAQAAGLRGIHLANGVPPPLSDPGADDPGVRPDAIIHGFDELVAALETFGLPSAR
jgi:putative hydrolase of the HAD superfamily